MYVRMSEWSHAVPRGAQLASVAIRGALDTKVRLGVFNAFCCWDLIPHTSYGFTDRREHNVKTMLHKGRARQGAVRFGFGAIRQTQAI